MALVVAGLVRAGPGLRARLVDVLVAIVGAVMQLAGTIVYSQDEPIRWDFDAWAYLLLVAGTVALLFRRLAAE